MSDLDLYADLITRKLVSRDDPLLGTKITLTDSIELRFFFRSPENQATEKIRSSSRATMQSTISIERTAEPLATLKISTRTPVLILGGHVRKKAVSRVVTSMEGEQSSRVPPKKWGAPRKGDTVESDRTHAEGHTPRLTFEPKNRSWQTPAEVNLVGRECR